MLCKRCLTRVLPRSSRPLSTSAIFHAQPVSPNAAQTSTQQRSPPAATSTAAAQPFSTPQTYSPDTLGVSSTKDSAKTKKVVSSVPAGKPLKGLNYFKNKEDPVALEDHEYPDWLWTLLDEKKKEMSSGGDTDPRLYSKSATTRQKANKAAKAKAAAQRTQQQRIPVFEQSIDLPGGNESVEAAMTGVDARTGLTRAMREKRRKGIKEGNFLKAMG